MGLHFLFPEILFALGLLAIPIIVHLFNFRKYKKIFFTNVRFLKQISEETQSKSKLKHLLVLACRLAFLLFLILAFSQPYIPSGDNKISKGVKNVSVFVDNSFSMDSEGKNGKLLEIARAKAKEIANAYGNDTRFQLLTNDFESKQQHLIPKEKFLQELEKVKISSSSKSLSEVFSRQADAIKSGVHTSLAYIISDFQKEQANFEKIKNDSSIRYYLIPLINNTKENIYIDTISFSNPVVFLNQSNTIKVTIKNTADKEVNNVPVKLYINNVQKAVASVNLKENESVILELPFTINQGGFQEGKLTIQDHPVSFDDDYYFSFKVADVINILSINGNGESKYLNALFNSDKQVVLKNSPEKQTDYSSLSQYNLIILNELQSIASGTSQELTKYLENGGNLVVFPSTRADLNSFNDFFNKINTKSLAELVNTETKISKIETNSSFYKGVFEKVADNIDLPLVSSHFSFKKSLGAPEDILLKMNTGESFLSKFSIGKGSLYLFAVPLEIENSGFPEHAILVPTLYKIAVMSSSEINPSYVIGRDNAIAFNKSVATKEASLHITGNESVDIIPDFRAFEDKMNIYLHDQINKSGNYNLISNGKKEGSLSFNFDRKESVLEQYSSSEISELTERFKLSNCQIINAEKKSLDKILSEINEGKRLWKICVIAALFFLTLEILLIKLLK